VKQSSKFADIQPGRVIEIAATGAAKPVAVQITEVIRFSTETKVLGYKLTRNGAPHPKGRVKSFTPEAGRFLVKWDEDVSTPAVAAEPTVETSGE
jgi:hypothetical protein